MKLRHLFLFLLIIVAAVLIAGQVINFIQTRADVSTAWVNHRYALAMQEFPKIRGKTVLFLGASEVESGVNPAVFAQHLADPNVASYNFGFRNMSPRNLRDLILQMQFSRNDDLKIEAIYIKLSPADLTVTSQIATEAVDDEVTANVLSNSFLMRNLTFSNLKALVIKNLQGGSTNVNLNSSVRFLGLKAYGLLTNQEIKSWNELDAPRYHLWIDRRYNGKPEWDPSRNGFHDRAANLKDQSSRNELSQIYEQQREPKYLKFNFGVQEQRSEAISLHLSQKLVSEFQTQVDSLVALTENVVLFYFPDHPAIPRNREAALRAEKLLDQMCARPRIRCLRFDQDGSFAPEDYYDSSHLNPAAVDKLTARLADDFKKMRPSK